MEPTYLKINIEDKRIYFVVTIDKKLAYFAHDIDFQNYTIKMSEVSVYDKDVIFDDTYGGLFLCIDDDKNVKIYDNIKKIYVNVESEEDISSITYEYEGVYETYYHSSLDNIVKEMLYRIIIESNL